MWAGDNTRQAVCGGGLVVTVRTHTALVGWSRVLESEATQAPECRVLVSFPGHRDLYFRADREAADRFAAAAARIGAIVTVDDHISAGLRPLPCLRLWQWP
jgi:hypothetical protein